MRLLISEKAEGYISPAGQIPRRGAESRELGGGAFFGRGCRAGVGEGVSRVSSGLAGDEEGRHTPAALQQTQSGTQTPEGPG